MKRESDYLRWLFGTSLAVLAAVATFNFAVDPYSRFGTTRIAGFNANKPDFVEQLRLTHAYAVEARKPRCIILGTSRTARGIDAANASIANLGCYNMGLPGVGLYEMRRYFQHAQAVEPLQQVFVGLDLRVFHTAPDTSGAFSEARLKVDEGGRPQFNLFSADLPDLARALLSLSALNSSVRTVRQQGWVRDNLAPDGTWVKLDQRFDHRAAFAAMTKNTFVRFAAYRGTDYRNSLEELRALLRECHASGVRTTVFISPSHAWHWEALDQAGLWGRLDAIKRTAVEINVQEAIRAGRPPFALWDFSGPYGPNLEPLPARPGELMRWYWEPVHYKHELGDLVLERMLGEVPREFPDFGVQLDQQNIEAHLAHMRVLQTEYRRANPEAAASVKSMM